MSNVRFAVLSRFALGIRASWATLEAYGIGRRLVTSFLGCQVSWSAFCSRNEFVELAFSSLIFQKSSTDGLGKRTQLEKTSSNSKTRILTCNNIHMKPKWTSCTRRKKNMSNPCGLS